VLAILLGMGDASDGAVDDDRLVITGRVLDPDGKPVGGAVVFVVPTLDKPPHLEARATTDAEGRFRFEVTKSKIPGPSWLMMASPWKLAAVLAAAQGYGPDWEYLSDMKPGKPIEFRLVRDDVPIEGMIADLEGRPVAGITLRPTKIAASLTGRLDTFLEAFREDPFEIFQFHASQLKVLGACPPGVPREITTDAEGRFRLTGIGRERIVDLEVGGPEIESRTIHALTRANVTIRNPLVASREFKEKMESSYHLPILYGARFHHIAGPTRPIIGTVREKGTGRPIAGAEVIGSTSNREGHARTETDGEGRYRLVGLPTEGKIFVSSSVIDGDGRPFLTRTFGRTLDGANRVPLTIDFDLTRGVRFRGRLTDAATGLPVLASVTYVAFSDNPYAQKETGKGGPSFLKPDGSFEVIGLPGPGVLATRAGDDRFCMSRPEQWDYPSDEHGFYSTVEMGIADCSFFHKVARVNPGEETTEVTVDIALNPGLSVQGKLVGPDGQPVVGTTASGLTALGFKARLPGSEFTATGLEPDRPRMVWFLNEKMTLGGMVELPGAERGPLTVRLQPTATLTGRVVDEEGRPRPDVAVGCAVKFKPRGRMHESLRTDADGRFRVKGLLAGMTYSIFVPDAGKRLEEFKVRIGETRDLGDIVAPPAVTR